MKMFWRIAVLAFAVSFSLNGWARSLGETIRSPDRLTVIWQEETSDALRRAIREAVALSVSDKRPNRYRIELMPGLYSLTEPVRIPHLNGMALEIVAPFGKVVFDGFQEVKRYNGDDSEMAYEDASDAIRVVRYQVPDHIYRDLQLVRRGYRVGDEVRPPRELFWTTRRLDRAQWPTSGYAIGSLFPEHLGRERFFESQNVTPGMLPSMELWAHGYWGNDWADEYLPVFYDATSRRFKMAAEPVYRARSRFRFRLLGWPIAIGRAGEWRLVPNRTEVEVGVPWGSKRVPDLFVPVAENLLLIEGGEDILVDGLQFRGSIGDAVVVKGSRVRIKNFRVMFSGASGLRLVGNDLSISRCSVLSSGGAAIEIEGGDRSTLMSSNNVVERCRLELFGETMKTYQPGVRISGVGVKVFRNLILNGPHAGILLKGNDHVVSHNQIGSLGLETDDVGGIHIWRDWTQQGNKISDNFFYNIKGVGDVGAAAVYLDDQTSGTEVVRNYFANVSRGVWIGGGSDNVVVDNLMSYCSKPCLELDKRGMDWQRVATFDPKGELQRALRAVPYDREPYLSRYPELSRILQDRLGVPKRNIMLDNCIFGSLRFHGNSRQWQVVAEPLERRCSIFDRFDLATDLISFADMELGYPGTDWGSLPGK